MSVAAAGGSDGGNNNWKGKSHADDDQSQLSSSTDDEDQGDATRKRKLTSSPRPGLSKKYPGASKSFLDLTAIGSTDAKVLEDEGHHANKKRRLRVAAEEDRKLLDEDRDEVIVDADQAGDEVIVDADADIDTDDEVIVDAVVKDDDKAEGSAAKNVN